jgi:hypothetical protein
MDPALLTPAHVWTIVEKHHAQSGVSLRPGRLSRCDFYRNQSHLAGKAANIAPGG